MNNVILNIIKNINIDDKILKILPHQLATVDFLYKRCINEGESVLVFHKMGSGKTIVALLFSIIASIKKNIVIILPNINIKELWESQINLALLLLPQLEYNLENILFKTRNSFIEEIGGNVTNIILNKIQKYNDYIVIIDEAHNFFGNDSGDSLIKLRKSIKNTFILLTGSPITNTVSTLKDIVTLMTGKEFDLTEYIDIQGTRVFEKHINKKGEDFLLNTLKGKISYYIQDPTDIPKVLFEGKQIYKYPIVECKMSKIQEKYYNLVKEKVKNEMFLKYMMNASFVALGEIENFENFQSYIESPEEKILLPNLSIVNKNFKGKELIDLNVSTKLKYFVDTKLKQSSEHKGKVFSYFANSSIGSKFIRAVMLANGVSEYKKDIVENFICTVCNRKRECKKCIPMRFVIITSKEINLGSPSINEIINIFNKKTNQFGDELMFLFGSKILSEAYTLVEVREIWFLTIPETKSELMQISARALRSFSYSDITIPVYIYILISTTSDTDIDKYIKHDYIKKPIGQTTFEISMKQEKIEKYINELNNNNKLSYDIKKLLYLEIKSERSSVIHKIFKSLNEYYNSKPEYEISLTLIIELMRRYCYLNSRFLIDDFVKLFKQKNEYIIDKQIIINYIDTLVEDGFPVHNKKFGISVIIKNPKNKLEIITHPVYLEYNNYLFSYSF